MFFVRFLLYSDCVIQELVHYIFRRKINTCVIVILFKYLLGIVTFAVFFPHSLIIPQQSLLQDEVRKLAAEFNLPNKDRKDSQGICFLGKVHSDSVIYACSVLGERVAFS